MLVINLFGVPGAGKSTGAAYIFSQLKMKGINAELVTEFAKDKVWENNTEVFKNQAYLFGKQSYRLSRCKDKVDVIVTDSPLPLSIVYNADSTLGDAFNEVVLNVFDTYENMNFFVVRVEEYNPKGRSQTELESDALGLHIRKTLELFAINHQVLEGDRDSYDYIVSKVVDKLEGRDWIWVH